MNRRRLLQFSALHLGGLWLPALLQSSSRAAGAPRARACILLFMDGGPAHQDMWDMKPAAPEEIRGPFRPISSKAPGVQVCEHLPRMARQMHRVAQIRSMTHSDMVHPDAVYRALTGRVKRNSAGDPERKDFPHVAAAFGMLDRQALAAPRVVSLPEVMKLDAGFVLPGQNAGFLGPSRDPFLVEVTPELEIIKPDLDPPRGVESRRLLRRRSLLDQVDGSLSLLRERSDGGQLSAFQQDALAILSNPAVSQAFDLGLETPATRDLYGRHRQGQSTLLARRLVEAGTRFVSVYWGRERQYWADGNHDRIANNPWDGHRNHFPLMKDELMPRADQAFAALLQDLHERGMLQETLVVWMGEFGRAPKISEFASREHWPYAYTVLLAGAGITGGAVYGATDAIAGEVTENPVTPADLTATLLASLGVDPGTLLYDRQGRPYPLSEGNPVSALWH